jgi:hypothetical protein
VAFQVDFCVILPFFSNQRKSFLIGKISTITLLTLQTFFVVDGVNSKFLATNWSLPLCASLVCSQISGSNQTILQYSARNRQTRAKGKWPVHDDDGVVVVVVLPVITSTFCAKFLFSSFLFVLCVPRFRSNSEKKYYGRPSLCSSFWCAAKSHCSAS